MKAITAAFLLYAATVLMGGCRTVEAPVTGADVAAARVVIASPAGTARPPFRFSAEDEAFLDLVQRGGWNWAMQAANKTSGMVPDRDSKPYISVAGVGFQLAAFPVAVERGWISRTEAERRIVTILRTLAGAKTSRKFGMYQHFVDGETGELSHEAYEDVVSTIDSALLFSGCLVASSYFGGEVAALADGLVADADWAAFLGAGEPEPHERGYLSLGWKPDDQKKDPTGPGKFLSYYWQDSGCEHRLCTFLAVAAPDPSRRIPPSVYYRLRRQIGGDAALGEKGSDGSRLVYFPWSGALFTNQFSHLFLNYASMGPDDPAGNGVRDRARVDWWENARRTTNLHRARAVALRKKDPGSPFGEHAWGFTASDRTPERPGDRSGYQVAGCFPELDEHAMSGSRLLHDFSWYRPKATDPGDDSIAPYAAGMCVLFEPSASVSALRNYRQLAETTPALAELWRDPAAGGHGFADAYNAPKGWVAPDHLAIDQLPMLLAIENARTGLVWRLFHRHPVVKAGMERLNLELDPSRGGSPPR
ncbi:MAG TPA: glucoamylase family protein [Phycisphaerales bacterium]|nr:glucoamylase family protein [Phycisphaerales bacterium]